LKCQEVITPLFSATDWTTNPPIKGGPMEPLPEITRKMFIPSEMTLKREKNESGNSFFQPQKSAGPALFQQEGFHH